MKKTRFFAAILALAMLISVLPASVFAAPGKGETAREDTTAEIFEQLPMENPMENPNPATSDDVEAVLVYTYTKTTKSSSETFADGNYVLFSNGVKEIVYSNGSKVVGRASGKSAAPDTLGDSDVNPGEVWTLTAVDGGYTLTDANGKYMQLTRDNDAEIPLVESEEVFLIGKQTAGSYVGSDYLYLNVEGSDTQYSLNSRSNGVYKMYNKNQLSGVNNSYYFYAQGEGVADHFVVKSASIAAAAEGVKDWFCYSAESWAAYQAALEAVSGEFSTAAEAMAALDALKTAKEALVDNGADAYVSAAYARVSPVFAEGTDAATITNLVDGRYVLVRAEGSNAAKAIVPGENGPMNFASDYTFRGNVVLSVPASYIWNITETGEDTVNSVTRKTFRVTDSNGRLMASNITAAHIVKPTGVSGSVTLGRRGTAWVKETNNTMSAQNAGTDSSTTIWLYGESGVALLQNLLNEATNGVTNDSRYYTAESWAAYQAALAAAEGSFATFEEAKAALDNLKAAVAALESSGFKQAVFNFSKLHNMSWTRTIDVDAGQSLSGHVYTQEELGAAKNYVGPINYVNHSGAATYNGVEYPQYTAITWNWSQLERLVKDQDLRTGDVWTQNASNGAYYCKYSTEDVIGGGRHNSDWQNEDFYKIAGTFVWPEGYDLFKTTVTLESINDADYTAIYDYIDHAEALNGYFDGKIIPVNDDVYVVMWAEVPVGDGTYETKPLTEQDMDEHLLFWTGTTSKGIWSNRGMASNDWARTAPATFLTAMKQGVRAFYRSFPNLVGVDPELTNANVVNDGGVQNMMGHTDGWYTITDTSAINSVLRSNYPNGIPAGTVVHLDLYLGNNSSFGMIDELEISLTTTEETTNDIRVEYYLDAVGPEGYLGTTYMLDVPFGTAITLLPGTNANQLNHLHAAAIAKAGQRNVTNGVQLGTIPYVVQRGQDNVIYVLYIRDTGTKTVVLTAETKTVEFDNNDHTADQVTVDEIGEATGGVRQPDGSYLLPDGNILRVYDSEGNLVTDPPASVTERLPGTYPNPFEGLRYEVTTPEGDNVTNSYSFIEVPGSLTITYDPAPAVVTYDFGIENVYNVFDATVNGVEKLEQYATITVSAQARSTEDVVEIAGAAGNGTNLGTQALSYTPMSVNTGFTAIATLTFTGNYQVTKTITIYPASNVWYDDNMFTLPANNKEWNIETEKIEELDNIVTDNDLVGELGLVHGYTSADLSTKYGNDSVLTAVVTPGKVTSEVTATFKGTGFDLIANCGTDTGMFLVAVKNLDTNKYVKIYMVDTYYSEPHGANQVPVIRNMDLPYANYALEISGYLGASAGALQPEMPNAILAAVPAESLMSHLHNAGVTESLVDDALRQSGLMGKADVEIVFMDEASMLNENRIAPMGAETMSTTEKTVKVYLDGFRVYHPLGSGEPAIYTTEHENDTLYKNAYDFVAVSTGELNGVVEQGFLYVEYEGGETDRGTIADYKNQGPHNELYLASGNAIAFALNGYQEGMTVQVSAKAVNGSPKLNGNPVNGTEMYYNIVPQPATVNGETIWYVVVQNTSTVEGELLAISAVKYSSGISTYGSIGLAEALTGTVVEDPNATYVPEKLEISRRTLGKSVVLSFTTDTRVQTLRVSKLDAQGNVIEGSTVTLTPTNQQAVVKGRAQYYTFTYSTKILADTTFQIVASNGNESSAPILVTVAKP